MMEAITSLRRTPYQTIASLSVLFFTLFLSGLLFSSLIFLQGLLHFVETRPRVIVYFQVKADDDQIRAVETKIKNSNMATEVKFVSKEEAFNIYKDIVKNDPLLLEMTTPDILPTSLEIDVKKPEYLQEVVKLISNDPGVDEVQFQKDIINNLLKLTSSIRRIAIFSFVYLMFMSTIVLITTISFKIALKKDDISILKLLGATNMYIRKPFINEGLLLGVLATAFANVVIIGVLIWANAVLAVYFKGVPNLSTQIGGLTFQVWPFNLVFASVILAVTAIFSLLISLISSFVATNRYL